MEKRKPRPVLISLVDPKEDRYTFDANLLSLAKIASVSKCAYHSAHKSVLPPRPKTKANTCVPSPPGASTPIRSLNQSGIKDRSFDSKALAEGRGRFGSVSSSNKVLATKPKKTQHEEPEVFQANNASANPNDGSCVEGSCRNSNINNKSSFIVFTHEDVLREELEGSRRELHKERIRNAELWSVSRKADSELAATRKFHDKMMAMEKKSDLETENLKVMLEKQGKEMKEAVKFRDKLMAQNKSLERGCEEQDTELEKVASKNSVYERIVRKLLQSAKTRQLTIETMKALHIIPATVDKGKPKKTEQNKAAAQ